MRYNSRKVEQLTIIMCCNICLIFNCYFNFNLIDFLLSILSEEFFLCIVITVLERMQVMIYLCSQTVNTMDIKRN